MRNSAGRLVRCPGAVRENTEELKTEAAKTETKGHKHSGGHIRSAGTWRNRRFRLGTAARGQSESGARKIIYACNDPFGSLILFWRIAWTFYPDFFPDFFPDHTSLKQYPVYGYIDQKK